MTDFSKSRDGVQRLNFDLGGGNYGEVVTPRTQSDLFRATFAKAITSGTDPEFFTLVGQIGSGIGLSQTGGNLVITSGTTANSELILRSTKSFDKSFVARWQTILSQRIANNNFVVELVDVLGDGLAYTIESATSVKVTLPEHGFSSENVGQSISIGAITGASGVPGRYAIASVSNDTITFTVAGWPSSGDGTCSLFGWNFHRTAYSGTTATNASYDSGRNGYASGDTTSNINTTASPGHMGIMTAEDGCAGFQDTLVSTSSTRVRVGRVVNVCRDDVPLFVQIRCTNGTTNPASTTTWTLGLVSVSDYESVNVAINNIRPQLRTNGGIPTLIEDGNLTAVGTVSVVTNAGTPAVPATPYFVNSAASTNGALILTGTSGLQALWATNTGATDAFVKLYNKATAPTVGTDIPEMIIPVPAAVSGLPGVAQISPGFNGYRFPLGLGIAITGGAADTDTTAVAAGQVKVKLSRTV